MNSFTTRTIQVALFGRVADELTRDDLNPRRYRAALRNHDRRAVQKDDGHFAFANLAPSPPDYEIEFSGPEFQTRRIDAAWPGVGAVEVSPPGEDELQVIIIGVSGNRVSFASRAFLPTIRAGAPVFGEGGFTTTLADDLEGVEVQETDLQAAGGLAQGQLLRIIRSRRLLLHPGPYYPFPPGATLAAFRVVENTAGDPPVQGAQLRITEVNSVVLAPVVVGGVTLFRADLPGVPPPPVPPPIPYLLGTDAARTTTTNVRGDAIFCLPLATLVTSLTVGVSRGGYVAQTPTFAVQQEQRSFNLIRLDRN